MSFRDKLKPGGCKRLLALDGGGIRGAMTLEVLLRMETLLRERHQRPGLVLADHFDYVAGTSTGAIIATFLALGWEVQKLLDFYTESGPDMFTTARLVDRLHYKFTDEPLARRLRGEIGTEPGTDRDKTLGSESLQTLLLVMARNATTDSPWPVCNNPAARYNLRTREDGTPRTDCNLDLPLWQLVRASTAAPTYFPPESVALGTHTFLFVDGGATMYNNPAFQLFLMATVERYALRWPTGEERMLLVSIGTGANADENLGLKPGDMDILYNAKGLPGAFMFGALNEQDFLCRVFGRCQFGEPLDREVGDMITQSGGPVEPKLFRYARYNATLTDDGLAALGVTGIRAKDVRSLDSIEHVEDLKAVGRALANKVTLAHID